MCPCFIFINADSSDLIERISLSLPPLSPCIIAQYRTVPITEFVVGLLQVIAFFSFAGEGHHICIDFHAHKDKLVKESLTIKSNDGKQSLKLILMARVLGK